MNILLISCIEPLEGIKGLKRLDKFERELDTLKAYEYYLKHPEIKSIIFLETSKYPLDNLLKLAVNYGKEKDIYIAYYLDSDKSHIKKGTGYAEQNAIKFAHKNFDILRKKNFIKISARLIIKNIEIFNSKIQKIALNIDFKRKFIDSRVVELNNEILKHFFVLSEKIDIRKNYWFEHALFDSYIKIYEEKKIKISILFTPPEIDGFSGAVNKEYKNKSMDKIKFYLKALFKIILKRKYFI